MRMKLQESPRDLWRRVAQKLESVRGTPMAEGADGAHLGDEVCPIYRPDIAAIAYWEFEVVGLKATRAREHEGRSSGSGFILATAGRHDVPIPHWSLTAEPPSRALEAKAGQGKAARIVKLDSLAYAAEDASGTFLANLGQFPVQIAGIPADATVLQGISTVTATPGAPTKDDKTKVELKVERSGAEVPKLKVTPWKSWPEAKRSYAKAYQPHLAALVAHAAPAWEAEDLLAKFGEGIHEGQQLTVPLLQAGKASLTGDGAKFVKLTPLDRKPPAVVLAAQASGTQGEAGFQLVLTYADRTSETLQFFVIPNGTPSNNRGVLPHLLPQMKGGV